MSSSHENSTRKIKVSLDPIEPVDSFGVEVSGPADESSVKKKRSAVSKKTSKSTGKKSSSKVKSNASDKSTDAVVKKGKKLVDKSTDTEGHFEPVKSEADEGCDGVDSKIKTKPSKTSKTATKTKATKSKTNIDGKDTKAAKSEAKATKSEAKATANVTKTKAKESKATESDAKAKDTKVAKDAKTGKKVTDKKVKETMTAVKASKEAEAGIKEITRVEPEFNGLDLLISFDTTGSMYPVLANVRREVDNLVNRLFKSVDNIRIGIIAHGDYCDADNPYTIRFLDFTTDKEKLSEFVNTTAPTYGGDADECYELVLNVGRTKASWRADVSKIFMVIGDANPHSPSYRMNVDKLDWKDELNGLVTDHVQVFGVHCLHKFRRESTDFYTTLANVTNGVYLTLDQFNDITGLIEATCYSQYSEERLNEFVTIIRDNSRLTRGLARNINRLSGKEIVAGVFDDDSIDYGTGRKKSKSSSGRYKTDSTLVQKEGLIPVTPGRFQRIPVDEDIDIKSFVEYNGIIFKRGRGFYELSKSEKVQQYKEIILEDRETGEMFNGAQVREFLGLQPQIAKGGVTERLNSHHTKTYRVFVQSTSNNRKLIGGTSLLYEVELDR